MKTFVSQHNVYICTHCMYEYLPNFTCLCIYMNVHVYIYLHMHCIFCL